MLFSLVQKKIETDFFFEQVLVNTIINYVKQQHCDSSYY